MKMTSLCGTTALALCLNSHVALADVTPEQIWEDWQKMFSIFGQELTVESAERDGDTLVVSGIKTVFTTKLGSGADEVSSEAALDMAEMRFRDQGDGTVEVTFSDTFTVTSKTTGPQGMVQEQVMEASQPGLVLIASGDEGSTTYNGNVPEMGLKQTVSMGGKEVMTSTSTYKDVEGAATIMQSGENLDVDYAGTVGLLDTVIKGSEENAKFDASFNAQEVGFALTGTVPPQNIMQDPAKIMDSGFGGKIDFVAGKGSFSGDFDNAGSKTKITGTGEGGSLSMGFGKDGLSYSAKALASETTIASDALPVPEIKLSYSAAGFDLAFPLAETPAPADFLFGVQLVDLAISDEVWALFDPAGELPRDPATVLIDTTGKARIVGNIFEPTATTPPPELHALTIKDITASVAGATLLGKGDLTFDNSDLVTFNGMPKPTGKVDLTLTGSNTLIDKLVKIGLLPEDQAQGFRMMVAMFAKPGEGEDVLQSTLEFKDGGFFANGMQLQ